MPRLLVALMCALISVATLAGVGRAEEGCCQLPGTPPVCHNSTKAACEAEGPFVTGGTKFVANSTCAHATGKCIERLNLGSAGINGPTRVFVGQSVKLSATIRNSQTAPVVIQKITITLTGPTPEACTTLELPVGAVPVTAGGVIDIPVLDGPPPAGFPTGRYTVLIDVFGQGDIKIGGGSSTIKLSESQGKVSDQTGDCRLSDGQPAPQHACASEFDAKAYHTVADSLTGQFYGRIDLFSNAVTDSLGPTQESKSWNVVIGGSNCTFGGVVSGVNYVYSVSETTFGQPGSP